MPRNNEHHEASDFATSIAYLAEAVAEAEDLMAEFAREKFAEAQRLSRKMRGNMRQRGSELPLH